MEKSLIIAFNHFMNDEVPDKELIEITERFLKDSVALGMLKDDYIISTDRKRSEELYHVVKEFAGSRFKKLDDIKVK